MAQERGAKTGSAVGGYYGRPPAGGGGDADQPRRSSIDQDDVAAAVMVILLLLLLGWGGWIALSGDGEDQTAQAPQPAAPPAPQAPPAPEAADPFLGAPVDLTPQSADPGPAPEEPAAVPALAEPPVLPASAPQPDTVEAPVLAPTCDPGRVLRAYFCTASAELTPQARSALEQGLEEMGVCAEGREWVVHGFADTRGEARFNTELSAQRAAAVSALLKSRGLSVAEAAGVGELPDMQAGQDCASQRRVDVSLKTSQPPTNRSCAPIQEEEALVCP